VFHSLRCDCRAQLELAFVLIADGGTRAFSFRHKKAGESVC